MNTAGTQNTSGTATLATSVTATANNSANETVYLTFVDGATGTQGIETDTGLTYNPSSGLLTTASVSVTANTGSTSKTTGALQVTGGVGIVLDLNVGGDITAYASSDKRLKTNITKIESPLNKLDKINGYTFDWIPKEGIQSQEGSDVGVIAQEIEEVLPEITTTRENGYKAVKYEKIIPLLIESIKEQQRQIEDLRNEVDSLKK